MLSVLLRVFCVGVLSLVAWVCLCKLLIWCFTLVLWVCWLLIIVVWFGIYVVVWLVVVWLGFNGVVVLLIWMIGWLLRCSCLVGCYFVVLFGLLFVA